MSSGPHGPILKGHHQFQKINFAHQFLAKVIPPLTMQKILHDQ